MTSVLSALLSRSWRALLIPIVVILGPTSAGVAAAQSGTWISNGPEGGTINALAIDPKTPSTLYAGTSGGGVFQSTDGGTSWRAINSGLTGTIIKALAIDPLSPSALYAGASLGGVFLSTDGGASWRAINTVPTAGNVRALAIDPQASSTLYAGTSGGGALERAHWATVRRPDHARS